MGYYEYFWGHGIYQRFEGKSKFRQDGSYHPKKKNQSKEEWRERKGFSKDQSKHRTWCKCGRYLKEKGNRQERRHTAKMIHHERWDEIFYHQDRWVSSWDAC